VKERGVDGVSSTFAGGALVINGITPGIVKVANNEAARELPDKNVLVCGPLLMLDGKATTLSESSDHTTSFAQRTVVGVTGNGTFLMVTIHGRKTPITGMSGLELQKLMAGLRAKDALNLDGGGSTALWANGGYVYSTTRDVANIVYVKK
jgi:exopolysaccharide biosynthesis protein